MASAYSADHQPGSTNPAVLFKRFKGICGTGGLIPTAVPDPGAEDKPVCPNWQRDQMRERAHP